MNGTFLLCIVYIIMVQDNAIEINVINELNQNLSKSNLIILPKMCNVTDYISDYNFFHVFWNQ